VQEILGAHYHGAVVELAESAIKKAKGQTIPDHPLDVVIEMKLVRMGTQTDGVDLPFSLVVEPGFDHVAGENIAAQKERMIAFERVKRLIQLAKATGFAASDGAMVMRDQVSDRGP
jgi:hypothetical protein